MAATPMWKIHSKDGEYIGAVKEPEYAAPLLGMLGDGSTLRYGQKRKVWTEGAEIQPAMESYDFVRIVAIDRQFKRLTNAR